MSHISKNTPHTQTLEYSQKNLDYLKRLGYVKSSVSKPYSKDKVIRYNAKRGVYWFSTSKSAHMSDCFFTQRNVGTILAY